MDGLAGADEDPAGGAGGARGAYGGRRCARCARSRRSWGGQSYVFREVSLPRCLCCRFPPLKNANIELNILTKAKF